jgi:hypothetical protein
MEGEMRSEDIQGILAVLGFVALVGWFIFVTVMSLNGLEFDRDIRRLLEHCDDCDTEDIEAIEKRLDAIEKKLGTHGGE